MMTNILSNLPEEYQPIVEILEDQLYNKYYPLTIERIRDKLSVKFFQMNKQSGPRTFIEDEKYLYVKSQYKGTCTTCGKYGPKKTAGIKKVQTYQNVITATNPDVSIKTTRR